MRMKDFVQDYVVEGIYQMIHPDIRDINVQLLSATEKEVFLRALEFMVMFDIEIQLKED